jgi:transcription initiation factor TFIIIB Brf1 subunit/transcription initiation factor TFIIB
VFCGKCGFTVMDAKQMHDASGGKRVKDDGNVEYQNEIADFSKAGTPSAFSWGKDYLGKSLDKNLMHRLHVVQGLSNSENLKIVKMNSVVSGVLDRMGMGRSEHLDPIMSIYKKALGKNILRGYIESNVAGAIVHTYVKTNNIYRTMEEVAKAAGATRKSIYNVYKVIHRELYEEQGDRVKPVDFEFYVNGIISRVDSKGLSQEKVEKVRRLAMKKIIDYRKDPNSGGKNPVVISEAAIVLAARECGLEYVYGPMRVARAANSNHVSMNLGIKYLKS